MGTITAEIMEKAISLAGGLSAQQSRILGMDGAFPRGWKKSMIGREFPDEAIAQFVALKDAHLKPQQLERIAARMASPKKQSKDRTVPRGQWTNDTREKLKSKRNDAEHKVKGLLNGSRVHFYRERPIIANCRHYFIDFLVTSIRGDFGRKVIRVAIEVDGGYHFTPEQQVKDRIKDADLLTHERVNSVLRISAEQAMGMTRERLREHLLSMDLGTVRRVY